MWVKLEIHWVKTSAFTTEPWLLLLNLWKLVIVKFLTLWMDLYVFLHFSGAGGLPVLTRIMWL